MSRGQLERRERRALARDGERGERKVPSFFSPCPFMFVGGAVGEIGRETGMRERLSERTYMP